MSDNMFSFFESSAQMSNEAYCYNSHRHFLSLSLCSLLAVLALCHCRLRAVPHLHPVSGWCADQTDALMGRNAHIKTFIA